MKLLIVRSFFYILLVSSLPWVLTRDSDLQPKQ